MKIYTIIAGVNGAGKSSFTGALKYQRDDLGIIIDTDRITAEQFGGDEYEGGKAAIVKIEAALQNGVNFTQETTLAGGYTKRIATVARDAGYFVRMYYIGIDTQQESRKRIKNRVDKGGHDIPDADIERRFARRVSSLIRVLPLCNEVVFFDNVNGFVEVGAYRNGEIVQHGVNCPAWLRELMQEVN